MRVIYEELRIIEAIARARKNALLERREIKEIRLSIAEAFKLLKEVAPVGYWPQVSSDFEEWLYYAEYCARMQTLPDKEQPIIQVMGVNIVVSWGAADRG